MLHFRQIELTMYWAKWLGCSEETMICDHTNDESAPDLTVLQLNNQNQMILGSGFIEI